METRIGSGGFKRSAGACAQAILGGGVAMLLAAAATAELPADVLEPSVTIEEFANRSEEAYWLNKRKAAIKVTPKHGSPYYLVDPDADGAYEMRRAGPDIDNKPSMWKLLQW
ncbi:MAG: DUF2782 domain-containing protein [Chromatiaceae bacterium]|nr:DUF2782 domain-containing protein [Gammaproteobacteria bacterium]MCP5314607.1 DUF2782 domain-containing protein [Chromatiaceae bacterium]